MPSTTRTTRTGLRTPGPATTATQTSRPARSAASSGVRRGGRESRPSRRRQSSRSSTKRYATRSGKCVQILPPLFRSPVPRGFAFFRARVERTSILIVVCGQLQHSAKYELPWTPELSSLFDAIPLGVYVFRLEGERRAEDLRIVYANDASRPMVGLDPKTVVGTLVGENFPP